MYRSLNRTRVTIITMQRYRTIQDWIKKRESYVKGNKTTTKGGR